jgi:hypothetical protein
MATRRGGRSKRVFTPEQIDAAKELLGRRVYPSRVAKELRDKFPDVNVPQSYRLIEAAQREVYESIRAEGRGNDLLTAQVLVLTEIQAHAMTRDRDRIAATAVLVKMLGMNKLIEHLGAGALDEFLGNLNRLGKKRFDEDKPKPSGGGE